MLHPDIFTCPACHAQFEAQEAFTTHLRVAHMSGTVSASPSQPAQQPFIHPGPVPVVPSSWRPSAQQPPPATTISKVQKRKRASPKKKQDVAAAPAVGEKVQRQEGVEKGETITIPDSPEGKGQKGEYDDIFAGFLTQPENFMMAWELKLGEVLNGNWLRVRSDPPSEH